MSWNPAITSVFTSMDHVFVIEYQKEVSLTHISPFSTPEDRTNFTNPDVIH